MRTTIKVGEITLKNGEMLQITEAEFNSLIKSKQQNGMGDVFFPSLKRMIQKPWIVDVQEKWVVDPNTALFEERPLNILAEGTKVVSDGNGPGYKKFLAMKEKLRNKL